MHKFLAGLAAGALAVCAGYALASRNASGTMSAVNGPYVAGTVITSSTINSRYADIEAEITDSLSRSGKGGMTAALRGADGTVAAPEFSFTNETGTGVYRCSAGVLCWAILGVKAAEWNARGLTFNGHATPGSPANGDVWYDTTLNLHALRSGGVTYTADAFVVAGTVVGATGAITAQRGPLTATVARTGVGNYTLTVPGMTGSAIITCTPHTGATGCIINPGAGSGPVVTFTTNTAAAADINWTFEVVSL